MNSSYGMDVKSFLRFGMENAKKYWLKFFLMIALIIGIQFVLTFIFTLINIKLAGIFLFISMIYFSFGIYSNIIKLSNGSDFDMKLFFPSISNVMNFFLGMILISIAVAIGTFFLVIPGIIIGIMLSLVPFLIIDKKMNFIDAIFTSIEMTKNNKMNIFVGLFISMLVVQLLSIPIITLFFTIPMSVFIQFYPYFYLKDSANMINKQVQDEESFEDIDLNIN